MHASRSDALPLGHEATHAYHCVTIIIHVHITDIDYHDYSHNNNNIIIICAHSSSACCMNFNELKITCVNIVLVSL